MLSTDTPLRFADKTLKAFDRLRSPSSTKAHEAAEALLGGSIDNLVLVGPTGAGKTHLAAAIVNAIREATLVQWMAARAAAPPNVMPRRGEDPRWANVADLIVNLRLDMDRPLDDRDASRTVLQLRSHPALVVLDDLGREKTSDWTGETIYSLVNHRYESMLPTLVTSNLTPGELGSSAYWPVISRLAEGGRLIDMSGTPDFRLNR